MLRADSFLAPINRPKDVINHVASEVAENAAMCDLQRY
jgi:hypothetical protein